MEHAKNGNGWDESKLPCLKKGSPLRSGSKLAIQHVLEDLQTHIGLGKARYVGGFRDRCVLAVLASGFGIGQSLTTESMMRISKLAELHTVTKHYPCLVVLDKYACCDIGVAQRGVNK